MRTMLCMLLACTTILERTEYDYPYDYDAYMADMAELNKFEVHFKCVKVEEPISEDGFQIDAS